MTLEERVHNLEQRVNSLEWENRRLRRQQEHADRMREIESISRMNESRMKLGLPMQPYPEVTFGISDDVKFFLERMEQRMKQQNDINDNQYPSGQE